MVRDNRPRALPASSRKSRHFHPEQTNRTFFRTDSSEEEVEEYEEGGDEEEHEGHLEYVGPNLMTSLEF